MDLNRARPIHFGLIDGVKTVQGGEGPCIKSMAPIEPGVLIAGKNAVATDTVAEVLFKSEGSHKVIVEAHPMVPVSGFFCPICPEPNPSRTIRLHHLVAAGSHRHGIRPATETYACLAQRCFRWKLSRALPISGGAFFDFITGFRFRR